MKKLTVEEKLSFIALALGKMPKEFTPAGWSNYFATVAVPAISSITAKVETMPDKAAFDDAVVRVAQRMSDKSHAYAERDENGVPYLLTDEMVTKAKSLDKLWANVLSAIRTEILPPCVTHMPHAFEQYLTDKFFYAYGTNSRICYFRDLDKPGKVWNESVNSEKPFTTLHGQIRKEMNATLCMHAGEQCVTVYRDTDNGQHHTETVNIADLYHECSKAIMARVQVTNKKLAYNFVVERMNAEIAALKNSWKGHQSKAELECGLKSLPEMYEEIETNLEFAEGFYRDRACIKTFTNDPNQDAFSYFDLSTLSDGETPAFDMFMSGVEPACRDTLMALIYANIDERCHLNQYIWMHGEGGDGKTSLLNAMREYLGHNMCCSLNTDSQKSEFGLEETVGKRMVVFPDVQSGLSVKQGIIHKLTGHDPVPINRKNLPHITTRIDCLLWIAANTAPDVNFSNANEARRCVYIRMCKPPEEVQKKIYFTNPDGSFQLDAEGNKINNGFPLEEMLIEEMPHILFKCRKKFEEKIPAPYKVVRLSIDESKLATNNCSDYDDDMLTYYIDQTFTFTHDDADEMAQPEITNALNMTFKCNNLPTMDLSMKRKMFRKIENYFGCPQRKVHGVKYRKGLKLKDDSEESQCA